MENLRKQQEESEQVAVSKDEIEKVNKSSDKVNNRDEGSNSYVKKNTEIVKDKSVATNAKNSNKKLTSYGSSSSIKTKDNLNKNNNE